MKIKKVEIQAFRAYDNVDDSTFNFLTTSNEIADFVAIHAPNGFGKTSFYDAVEWSFTNKITRYDRKRGFNSDLAKSERANSLDEDGKRQQQLILRNKDSKLEKGFVNLHTTLDEEPVCRVIPKVKKGSSDYKFEHQEAVEGTEHFHEVMLSQEWIDAFLKEDNAEMRYDKFVSSFGDIELNKKYKAVIELINLNKSNLSNLKKELNSLKNEDVEEYDSDILLAVNNEIISVNTKGEKLPLLAPNFSEKDDFTFSSLLDDRLEKLNDDIKKFKEHLDEIEVIELEKSINDFGLNSYFRARELILKNKVKLSKLIKDKDKLGDLTKFQIKSTKTKQELEDLAVEISSINKLLDLFPQYQIIDKEICKLNKAIASMDSSRVKQKLILQEKLSEQSKIKAKRSSISSAIENIKKESDGLQKTYLLMKENDNLLHECRKDIYREERQILDKNEKVNTKRLIIQDIETAIEAIKNESYFIDNRYLKNDKFGVSQLANKTIEYKRVTEEIEKLDDKVSKFDELNSTLTNLLNIGTTIITTEEPTSCPLCQHDYSSYEKLSKNVLSNPLLNNEIKNLVEEKARLESELRFITDSKESLKKGILSQFKVLLNEEEAFIGQELMAIHKSNLNLHVLKEREEKLSEDISKTKLKTLSLPIDEYQAVLLSNATKYENELSEVLKDYESLEKGIFDQQTEQKTLEAQLNKSRDNILKLSQEEAYKLIRNFLSLHDLPENTDEHSFISKYYIEKVELNKSTKTKLEGLISAQKVLVEELPSTESAYFDANEKELIDSNFSLEANIAALEMFVTHALGISIRDQSEAEVRTIIKEKGKQYFEGIEQNENIVSQLLKIRKYKANVVPFLKAKENQKLISNLKKEIKFLESSVSKELKKEKDKLAKYIDKQIESFFYQKLINVIYKKIDPHPIYNEISFQCDFTQDKPRLNVFVSGGEKNAIVPALYFSTAQLNILSLSIFLAKALNTKDSNGNPINCIFIDDPIQSMDSINILSTIDLFRSIVSNMGKQIILSTHDENFQNLLKKKMPEDLFRAKYIEFETFGKLKAS